MMRPAVAVRRFGARGLCQQLSLCTVGRRWSHQSAGVVTTVQSSPYAQTHTTRDVINFGIGQPSPSLLPSELFQQAAQHRFRVEQDPSLFQYGAGSGYVGFRAELARFLSWAQSTSVDPNEFLITAGNSQAISHAAIAFAKQNKRVFVEEPTYFLAFDIFREIGLDLAPVHVDEGGVDVNALEKRLKAGDVPAFLYTIPFFHNPTSVVITSDRRERLLSLAQRYGFYIISDEPYNLLGLDGKTYPSLASYDTSGRVVSLGSFSKILAPGLRLGWAHGKEETLEAIASNGVTRSGGGQNPITAAMVHSVLELDLLQPYIQNLQRVFSERKAVMCEALRQHCPDCSFVEPQGGYFVWLQLPAGIDAQQLLNEAQAKYGVAFTPGHRCSLGREQAQSEEPQAIRLSFAFYSIDEIRVGIERLGQALRVIGSHSMMRKARLASKSINVVRIISEYVPPMPYPEFTFSCGPKRHARGHETPMTQRSNASVPLFPRPEARSNMTTKSKNPLVATTAGAVAGGIETLVIWPMEMIKTNLQLGTMRAHYSGMLSGFQYHVRTDGVLSLYRGLGPVFIGSIPKAGIRFGAFDLFKQMLADEHGQTSATRNLAAGMAAGTLEATLMTTPIETLKTKLIGANASMWQGTKMILAKEGVRGIYQGLFATILKQSSNQGLRFMFFSEYKKRVTPEFLEQKGLVRDAKSMSSSQHAMLSLVGGVSAGIFSTFGNNPFDVVKTRMQGLEASKYKSTFDCVKQMLRHEGPLVFYSGIVPRLGRVIPGQGVIFMTYDGITRFLTRHLESGSGLNRMYAA